MELLDKEEEQFLELLLEQDWDNDIQAYLKFNAKLPQNLKQQYGELIQSLMDKGYIKKKRIRYFLLSESAKRYKRNKWKYRIIAILQEIKSWIK